MPQLQVVDLNPNPRTETTPLEKTLSSFANRYNENRKEQRGADALAEIYEQYKEDGDNLGNTIKAISKDPRIPPTTRVNTVDQLLKFQQHNSNLQKTAAKNIETQAKNQAASDKAAAEKAEKERKAENNKAILADIELKRGLEKGALDPYEDNVGLAERTTRPDKEVKVNQADRPPDADQLRRRIEVEESPEFQNATLSQKEKLYSRAGLSTANTKAAMDPLYEEQKINAKMQESSYKAQEGFINEVTDRYKAFETDTKPKVMQMQKIATDDELIGPTAAAFMDLFDIPLGALENPASELYNKVSLDLLKGLPETYGNRILKVEVDNFLKTIPSLLNSPEGRRMIASNILKLGEMKEVYYKEMRKQQVNLLDSSKPFPRDFQQRVFDQVKPQIDRINNEFVQLSTIKAVPEGTIPFFNPDGEIEFVPKEHAQWAETQGGGKRIW